MIGKFLAAREEGRGRRKDARFGSSRLPCAQFHSFDPCKRENDFCFSSTGEQAKLCGTKGRCNRLEPLIPHPGVAFSGGFSYT